MPDELLVQLYLLGVDVGLLVTCGITPIPAFPHQGGRGVGGRCLPALLVDAAECGARVLEAELKQELCGFELVPGGAAGRVALHDGDDAADDAPAALSFVKDDALYGFPQPLVGVLF